MTQGIGYVTLLVRDYDEAIEFYTEKLQFDLLEDAQLSGEKRWVLVAPPGNPGCCLLLARAASPAQESSIGNQAGGRVFLFLHTDDFFCRYNEMKSQGIEFLEEPSAVGPK